MKETIDRSAIDRRTVLRGLGTIAVAGALAGCGGPGGDGSDGDGGSDGGDGSDGDGGSDGGDGSDGDGGDGGSDGGDGSDGDGGSDGGGDGGDGSDGGDGGDGGSGEVPQEVADYLEDADNFGGTIEDMTGQDEVTVVNGAEGNGGNFAFDPPAIRVDAGTTVVWEWSGQGGQHNVVHEDGAFESDLAQEEGFTFEHTFGDAGTYLYFCQPHKSLGMKGAVVVE